MQPSLAAGPLMAPGGDATGNVSESAGAARLYGALLEQQMLERASRKVTKRRRRLNCVPALLAVLVPWLLFVFAYCAACFYSSYQAPRLTKVVLGVIVLGAAGWALSTFFDRSLLPEERFYPQYVAVAVTLAVACGWLMGDYNFWLYTRVTYKAEHLATYTKVDPSSERLPSGEIVMTRGKRYQDAGKVYFKRQVVVDTNRSMSFKMGDLYCVAPIVNPKCSKRCGVDFWAVGMNCCAEDGSDFHCGELENRRARAGLRLLEDGLRPLYRLAVLQAEGIHGLRSPHPLFFEWLEDPAATLATRQRRTYARLLVAMSAAFLASGVLFVTAAKFIN